MIKTVAILSLLIATTVNAQAQRDWAFGISLVPTIESGSAVSIDAIRGYNNNWQLGYKIIYGFYKNEITTSGDIARTSSNSLGGTFSSRYQLFNSTMLRPYMLGAIGTTYYKTEIRHTYTPFIEEYDNWYVIYSVRFGSEIVLNQGSWSLDINLGYLGLLGVEAGDKGINKLIFSFGVLKRLTIKSNSK